MASMMNDEAAVEAVRNQKFIRRISDDSDSDDGQVGGDAMLPDAVITFLRSLSQCITQGETEEIHTLYEQTFNRLTDKYFKTVKWPGIGDVERYFNGSEVVITLYKELYYRHIYSKLQPTFDDRLQSWINYCSLFDYILEVELDDQEEREFPLKLPLSWIWDILDEFLYQFQTYPSFVAKMVKQNKHHEIGQIKQNDDIWDSRKVLWFLHQLEQKTLIRQYIAAVRSGEELPAGDETDAFGSSLAKYIGYFSVVGLMRVHALFGDYYLSLSAVQDIDFDDKSTEAKALFYRVTACNITVFYHLGFGYMMMRRYHDAISTFSKILLFLSRTSQFYNTSYQYDNMVKKMDQMFALLMICHSLCPVRLDESLASHLKEKHSEKMGKLARGDLACYEDLFIHSCPKFVSPMFMSPDLISDMVFNETFTRQVQLFVDEVKQQRLVPTIRGYLKLYSAIDVAKLSSFIECDTETLREHLLCVKHKQLQLVRASPSDPISGKLTSTGDVEFAIHVDMVNVQSARQQRKEYTQVFTQNISKFNDILTKLTES